MGNYLVVVLENNMPRSPTMTTSRRFTVQGVEEARSAAEALREAYPRGKFMVLYIKEDAINEV